MPRKRRFPKRRPALPTGLAAISGCERTWWAIAGPMIGADVDAMRDPRLYVEWPDWATWATFYGAVRDELHAARPERRHRSIADACFLAMQAGADPEAVRNAALMQSLALDPRRLLCRGN